MEDSEGQYFQSSFNSADRSPFEQLSVIILAAGESKRMGMPKATLMVDTQDSFLEYLIKGYLQTSDNEVVVVHSSSIEPSVFPSRVRWLLNNKPNKGRFYSIWLAAKSLSKDSACLIHNVDNPYVDKKLIYKLVSLLTPESYIVPTFGGKGGHPVLLGRKIVNFIADHPEGMDFREILESFERKEIACEDSRILLNINTKEEYSHFQEKYYPGLKTNNYEHKDGPSETKL